MSFDFIRKYYGVPAKRGGRIRTWTGEEGTISSTHNATLKVKMDEDQRISYFHPAWGIYYYDGAMQT